MILEALPTVTPMRHFTGEIASEPPLPVRSTAEEEDIQRRIRKAQQHLSITMVASLAEQLEAENMSKEETEARAQEISKTLGAHLVTEQNVEIFEGDGKKAKLTTEDSIRTEKDKKLIKRFGLDNHQMVIKGKRVVILLKNRIRLFDEEESYSQWKFIPHSQLHLLLLETFVTKDEESYPHEVSDFHQCHRSFSHSSNILW